MTVINRPPLPEIPTLVNFFINPQEPGGAVTYDGDIFPYNPLFPGDTRYQLFVTPSTTPVVFEAINSAHPHVVTPAGVTILEYLWDFGDGSEGYGPTVTHTYDVINPETTITLTILDSRYKRYSSARPLNLVEREIGNIVPFRAREENEETKPPAKLFASCEETVLSEDEETKIHSQFMHVYINDEALSKDKATAIRATLQKLGDFALASDIATRIFMMFRSPASEEAHAADIATANVILFCHTTDTALTEDGEAKVEYKLSFAGALGARIQRSFKASLGSSGRVQRQTRRSFKAGLGSSGGGV